MSRPRSRSKGRNRTIRFISDDQQKGEEEEWENQKEVMKTRKIEQETVKPLVKKIIKGIFNKPKNEWPRKRDTQDLLDKFNNAVMVMGNSAEVAKSIDEAGVTENYIINMANKYQKEAREEMDDQARAERYRREKEKEEEERQQLCKNFGICTAAALAAAGAGAVVGAPVIATTAAAATAFAGVGRARGAFGGRKKTRKRQRKSKRKSRRKKRKKRKKRKTRRLRRKSR